jgi:hypothetical protein
LTVLTVWVPAGVLGDIHELEYRAGGSETTGYVMRSIRILHGIVTVTLVVALLTFGFSAEILLEPLLHTGQLRPIGA